MSEVKAKVSTTTYKVRVVDLDVEIHRVEVAAGISSWVETFPSEELRDAFLRGVKAGCSMLGQFTIEETRSAENARLVGEEKDAEA